MNGTYKPALTVALLELASRVAYQAQLDDANDRYQKTVELWNKVQRGWLYASPRTAQEVPNE